MALSNATQQAPGKAHALAGKHGAKHAAQLTGLEFLTGAGADADGAALEGSGFASLVQSLAKSIIPATPKVPEAGVLPGAAETGAQPAATATVDNPDALLALALQGEKQAGEQAKGADIPVLPETESAVPPDPKAVRHGDKHKRAHDGKLRGQAIAAAARSGDEIAKRLAIGEKGESSAPPPNSETPGTPVPATSGAVPQSLVPGQQPNEAVVAAGAQGEGSGRESIPADARPVANSTSRPEGLPQPERRDEQAENAFNKISESISTNNGKEKEKSEKLTSNSAPGVTPSQAGQGGVKAAGDGDRIAPTTASQHDKGESTADKTDKTDRAEAPRVAAEPVSSARGGAPAPEFRSSAPSPAFSGASAQPVDLTAALGSQVVDMGVSGQWIDDIARQIASIGANPGHGSFRIESQGLGGVRVDIAPGERGSNVVMRVDNDAAFAALDKDRDRLMQDARMGSVRIGELRIDRVAAMPDAQGSGSATSQQNGNSGQQPGQQSFAQNNAQTGGQGAPQQGRPDASLLGGQGNGARDNQPSPKAPFTTTVMREGQADEASLSSRSGRSDSARYA